MLTRRICSCQDTVRYTPRARTRRPRNGNRQRNPSRSHVRPEERLVCRERANGFINCAVRDLEG